MTNWIDLVALLILVYFAYQGYSSGLLAAVLNLLTTILSLFLAILFYPNLSSLLENQWSVPENLSPLVAFFTILILLEMLLGFLSSRIYRLVGSFFLFLKPLFYLDKILGIIPSVAIGSFLITILLAIPLILPIRTDLKSTVEKSWWGRVVLPKALVFEPQLEAFLKKLPSRNLLYIITPNPESKETIKLEFPLQKTLTVDEKSEEKMLQLVNQERAKLGVKPLKLDVTIVSVARSYSRDMFERQYFSHYTLEGLSPFDRMRKGKVEFLAAGENLAYAPNVEIAHQGLMNSPGHRANILREEFARVGIGVIDGGIYGRMFTQNFAD